MDKREAAGDISLNGNFFGRPPFSPSWRIGSGPARAARRLRTAWRLRASSATQGEAASLRAMPAATGSYTRLISAVSILR